VEVYCTRVITLHILILQNLPFVFSNLNFVWNISQWLQKISLWNLIGTYTLMSGSVLHKNHNPHNPFSFYPFSYFNFVWNISQWLQKISSWNFIGTYTLMSGSVLHKNHNHQLPNYRVIVLCFVFHTWNMVFSKLQNEIHNLKQLKKISVISPRTEYDR